MEGCSSVITRFENKKKIIDKTQNKYSDYEV